MSQVWGIGHTLLEIVPGKVDIKVHQLRQAGHILFVCMYVHMSCLVCVCVYTHFQRTIFKGCLSTVVRATLTRT